jgi:hypothetical protein
MEMKKSRPKSLPCHTWGSKHKNEKIWVPLHVQEFSGSEKSTQLTEPFHWVHHKSISAQDLQSSKVSVRTLEEQT